MQTFMHCFKIAQSVESEWLWEKKTRGELADPIKPVPELTVLWRETERANGFYTYVPSMPSQRMLPLGYREFFHHPSKGHPSAYFPVHHGKWQHRRKSCSLLSIAHFLTDCLELGNVCIQHHCLSLDSSVTGSSWKALWWTQDLRVTAKDAMWSLLLFSLQFSSLFFFVGNLGKISRPTDQYLSFSTGKRVVESVISRLTPWARWWSSGRVLAGQVWGPASSHLHWCKSQMCPHLTGILVLLGVGQEIRSS